MASPVVASSSTVSESSNTTSRNLTKPTGTASGDWLLLVACVDGVATGSFTATDFTQVFLEANVSNFFAVYARLAGGSEPASYTVGTASEQGNFCLMRITGSSATTVAEFVNALSSTATQDNTYIPSLPVYATTPDTLIIRACGCDASTQRSITDPGSHTSVYNNTAPGTASTSLSVCTVDQASSGYCALAAFTLSGIEEAHGITLAITSSVTEDSLSKPVIKGINFQMPPTAAALVFTKPWGTVDNDLLLLVQEADVTGTLTTATSISPAFVAIDETSNTAIWLNSAYRLASSEGTSYTTSNTTVASKMGALMRIKNVDTAAPINQHTVATGNDATPTASTLTPSVNNCLTLTGFAADDDDVTNGAGFTSGWTSIISLETIVGSDSSFLAQFKEQTTATATGAVAMTQDLAEEWIAWNIAVAPAAAAGGYTLTADRGTFTLTGNATNLKADRKLTAATASFTLTGNAAGLAKGYRLTAGTASFALTGNATALKVARQLLAATSSFALTVYAAGLKAARALTAATASFTLTGNAAALKADRKLTAVTASFALTGNDATLTYTPAAGDYILSAESGSFALTGNDAALTYTTAAETANAGKASRKRGKYPRYVYVEDRRYLVESRQEENELIERLSQELRRQREERAKEDSPSPSKRPRRLKVRVEEIPQSEALPVPALKSRLPEQVDLQALAVAKMEAEQLRARMKQAAQDEDDMLMMLALAA